LFRTFVPFVAGVGSMSYARFTAFNVSGALLWVVSLCMLGFWFGNEPWIKQNLTLVIIGIIVVSNVPVVIGWWQHRKDSKAA
jgi:membrane-associated protein